MSVDRLILIFNVCMILGIGIPLLNIFIGTMGAAFHVGFDTDAGGEGALPFNLMSLCFSLIVFGALGRFLVQGATNKLTIMICIVASLFISIIAYVLCFKLIIKRLKANVPRALTHNELVGKTGTLTLRVTNDKAGTVSILDSTGAKITYAAKMSHELDTEELYELRQGDKVLIVDFDKQAKVCYVSPLQKY
ncbi:hypothetical protein CLCY_5c01650 [Clostridium cylindrosporum DSM 605]|uniref:NfeD-like C-terminal domain-containing protein n=1 Tax=Clostridium cylindrosporum DSM 605 TaxID=1121307 RepID=A0A0J8G5J7_CLOCY|nr:hypothetical protein CLCY_5c01650 [Clostridium cylindrosporum DSM 605]